MYDIHPIFMANCFVNMVLSVVSGQENELWRNVIEISAKDKI